MKTRTRITTAVAVALTSIFLSVPAFANEGGPTFNPADEFSTAGQPLQVYAILIVGAVLLAIVLIGSTLIGKLFDK